MSLRRVVGLLLVLAGASCAAVPIARQQRRAGSPEDPSEPSWAASWADISTALVAQMSNPSLGSGGESVDTPARVPPFLLVIERIGLSVVVPSECTEEALRRGPARLPGSGRPGAPTFPCIIIGHRNCYTAPFARLDRLRPGDQVHCHTALGRYAFVVVRARSASPDDRTPLTADVTAGLVLITCDPYLRPTRRLVVAARLSGAAEAFPPSPASHSVDGRGATRAPVGRGEGTIGADAMTNPFLP